jgi:transcriptional regulator with XRE-family HTH domain
MTIHQQIKDLRTQLGLTQLDLANKADISRATIVRIEQGGDTSIDTLSKVANAMGGKITYSLELDEVIHPTKE